MARNNEPSRPDARSRTGSGLRPAGVLQRGDGATALEIARDLLAADGCDESAAELAICALLQRRHRSEALRVFRAYSGSLQRELGLRPSHSVKALFEQTLTAAT